MASPVSPPPSTPPPLDGPLGEDFQHVAYVAVDVETTGLVPVDDHLYEIAIVAFDASGAELGHFETLVCPRMEPLSERLAPVALAPTFEAIAGTVVEWLRLGPVVGHNVSFDLAMIDGELSRFGEELPVVSVVDTLALAKQVETGSPDLRLATVAEYLGIAVGDAHTALTDARLASQVLTKLRAARVEDGGLGSVRPTGVHHGSSGDWPELPGRSEPLVRDVALFPPAVRANPRPVAGLQGTVVTLTSEMLRPSPEVQRVIDERTIALATLGTESIIPGAPVPEDIVAAMALVRSTDFAEALAASKYFLAWARDPSGELQAAEADFARGQFSGPDGLERLTRIVSVFTEKESVRLPEVTLALARFQRFDPAFGSEDVTATYRAAFELAWADDREFLESCGGPELSDDDDDDDYDDAEDLYPDALLVLEEWVAYLRASGGGRQLAALLEEFSDPVWGLDY